VNTESIQKIKSLAHDLRDEIISIRHHLHAHPELSFQEAETAKYISQKLSSWGIEHQTGIGGNGIVGVIESQAASRKSQVGRVVALRADIDALPITEQNEVEYKSQNSGVMHACGHDVHSSSLFGAIKILNEMKNDFEGTIKFIFQPAEEKLPGGASMMIKEGVLENPKPDFIIAQHVFTPLTVGKAGFFEGKYMASSDELYFTVKGKGGHAAVPQDTINPIFIAAHLVNEIEKLSKELSQEKIPTILTIGKITGPGATNVIPDEVKLEGTLRTMDEEWRKNLHQKLKQLVADFNKSHGGVVDIEIKIGYPCLINDEAVTTQSKNFAKEFLGEENVVDLSVWMASEDFAFYSQKIPACFYRIGTGNPEKGITSGVHTSTFNIDEDALEIASGMMAGIAMNLLSQ